MSSIWNVLSGSFKNDLLLTVSAVYYEGISWQTGDFTPQWVVGICIQDSVNVMLSWYRSKTQVPLNATRRKPPQVPKSRWKKNSLAVLIVRDLSTFRSSTFPAAPPPPLLRPPTHSTARQRRDYSGERRGRTGRCGVSPDVSSSVIVLTGRAATGVGSV